MGLGKKTIDDQNYCGKKVLVRCDFNVPMKDGVITNENRTSVGDDSNGVGFHGIFVSGFFVLCNYFFK